MSVILESQDNVQITVDKKAAQCSILIKNMIEDVGEDPEHPIPLPNVDSATLKKIVEYCERHKNDPAPQGEDKEAVLGPAKSGLATADKWDTDFIALDTEELFAIILAANYLDIKGLLDLGCSKVADMLKGKTVEQIRTMFNIENDFTPEEEEKIKKENEWAADC